MLNSKITSAGGILDEPNKDVAQNQTQLEDLSRLMPLVTTSSRPYLPLQHQLKSNFNKYTSDLRPSQKYRVISTHRRNKNLKDMLVRAKLPEQSGRTGLVRSNHWAFKPKQFIYNPHGRVGAPILQKMTLNMENIIYCILCEKCHRMYVGETGQTLLDSLKQHIYSVGENRLNSPLVLHFQIHPLQYFSITGLQACATWMEGQRKRQERMWISRLQTQHPEGLSVV